MDNFIAILFINDDFISFW